MAHRTAKTVIVSLPPVMLDELDRIRRQERRTRSELLREALRRYMADAGQGRVIPVEDALPDEIEAIRQGKKDLARGETISLEALQNELGLPTR